MSMRVYTMGTTRTELVNRKMYRLRSINIFTRQYLRERAGVLKWQFWLRVAQVISGLTQ